MLRIFLLAGWLLIPSSAFAQGSLAFNNRIGPVDAPVRLWDGSGPGFSSGWVAQLFLVTANGSLTPVDSTRTFRNNLPAASYYIVQDDPTIVPGILPGESATLRMRVWQNAATYDEAILKGESNDVTIQLGGSPRNAPPIPDPVLLGLQGFTILPEPAPGLLSLFAVGIFLFAARNERPSNKAR